MTQVDWQTAKARATHELARRLLHTNFDVNEYPHIIRAIVSSLKDSGYVLIRASDPPQHVRSLGFQAHANGGPKAFGSAYEAMVREMAKETAE